MILDHLVLVLDIIARRDDEHLDHHGAGLTVTLGDLKEPCAAEVAGEPDFEILELLGDLGILEILYVVLHGVDLGGGDSDQLVTHHLIRSCHSPSQHLIICSHVHYRIVTVSFSNAHDWLDYVTDFFLLLLVATDRNLRIGIEQTYASDSDTQKPQNLF